MNIKVEINVEDEFGTKSKSISETSDIDNETITESITTPFEIILEHMINALYGLGYSPKIVDKHISLEERE